jgi:hypothetical protein
VSDLDDFAKQFRQEFIAAVRRERNQLEQDADTWCMSKHADLFSHRLARLREVEQLWQPGELLGLSDQQMQEFLKTGSSFSVPNFFIEQIRAQARNEAAHQAKHAHESIGEAMLAEHKERAVEMPPGYRMQRVARVLFFFASKGTRRVFEEIVADYRYEMLDAEAKGATRGDLRMLVLRHWIGFVRAAADVVVRGLVAPIVKILKGG